MQWHLFLDDERFAPSAKQSHYTVVRSVQEAQKLCMQQGAPESVSLDHDLGDNLPTGMDFCKWLVEQDLDQGQTFLPEHFTYVIHSANPVGEQNMKGLLEGYLSFKRQMRANCERESNRDEPSNASLEMKVRSIKL